LRTTKLARSIRSALEADDHADDWLAMDLAAAVIGGLRARGDLTVVRTERIGEATVRVLIATGYPRAAAAYASVASDRVRRRGVMRGHGVEAALAGARATAVGDDDLPFRADRG
jgi:hypothetical protein